jgi:hypothetical protein
MYRAGPVPTVLRTLLITEWFRCHEGDRGVTVSIRVQLAGPAAGFSRVKSRCTVAGRNRTHACIASRLVAYVDSICIGTHHLFPTQSYGVCTYKEKRKEFWWLGILVPRSA